MGEASYLARRMIGKSVVVFLHEALACTIWNPPNL